jgi:uncharacterized LabA/DUF88 family protein
MRTSRTAFVIDGFNVYHSLVDASRTLGLPEESGTKWLNLRGLCESYLSVFGTEATLVGIHYFSALAHHLEPTHPGITARHQLYVRVLKETGVSVELGRFKKKVTRCNNCSKTIKRYEEKETDVAVAAKLFEILVLDQADRVVLMTGDTDLAPAVRTAKKLYLDKEVCFAFPWNRKPAELEALVTTSISITREAYLRHQLPDTVVIGTKTLWKPLTW